jgi:hypothetical protein
MIILECGELNNLTLFGNATKPYKIHFPKGSYLVELWGASGGGNDGGKGGYAKGILNLTSSRTLYIYVGGAGKSTGSVNGCIEGGWNGGGKACSYGDQSSGGGATDIRLSKNDLYNDRIIVAGGGGGAAGTRYYVGEKYSGGYGGGTKGGTAYGWSASRSKSYGELYATGGTQTEPGNAAIMVCEFTNENGKWGAGGMCAGCSFYCGGGGGGYYGGAGGSDVTGGGGGSGYFDPNFISNGVLLGGNEKGKTGNGEIRIITLFNNNCATKTKNEISLFLFVLTFIFTS